MKLSKTILNAILVGITVCTTTSCSNNLNGENKNDKTEVGTTAEEKVKNEKAPRKRHLCVTCGRG